MSDIPQLPSLSEILNEQTEDYFIPVLTIKQGYSSSKSFFRLVNNNNPEAAKLLYDALSPQYSEQLGAWQFGLKLPKLYGLSGAESDRMQNISNKQQEITRKYLEILNEIAKKYSVSMEKANEWFRSYDTDDEAYQKVEPYLDRLQEIDGLLQQQNQQLRNAEITVLLQERLGIKEWKNTFTLSLPTFLIEALHDYIEGERSQWKQEQPEDNQGE